MIRGRISNRILFIIFCIVYSTQLLYYKTHITYNITRTHEYALF